MAFIHPFEGFLVAAEWAGAVVAPPYDSLTPAERRRHADSHPENYLNAMRSVEEYASDEAPSLRTLLERNARFVRRYVEAGRFVAQPPCVFVYRLASHGHVQRGVVAEMSIAAYLDSRIRRHEFTRVAREDALAEYIDHVRTASSPVSLAYRADDGIRRRLDTATRGSPAVSHATEDGVEHDIWVVGGANAHSLIEAFEVVSNTYITDGHHRCAATARFSTTGVDARLLVVLFPDDELRILPYHRVVRDLGGHSTESFLTRLSESFIVEPLPAGDPAVARPRARGEFAVHVDGRWFRFRLPDGQARPPGPADAIDAAILQARVIGPLLAVTDPRDDERLGFVAGTGGLDQLERACREDWRAAFALYPTSMDELVTVADAGAVMPPKSTWFDPKPRSGFFFHDPLRLCGS
ncbi:MAG: DUF1015 family protein [Thiotrichales bacterium]|nr:DUF1015 family protein [Thiotrichales bacterium]